MKGPILAGLVAMAFVANSAEAAKFETIESLSDRQMTNVAESWQEIRDAISSIETGAVFEGKSKIISRSRSEKLENTVKQWMHREHPASDKLEVSRLHITEKAVRKAVRDVMFAGQLTGGDAGEPEMEDSLTESLVSALRSGEGVVAYKGEISSRTSAFTFVVVVDTEHGEILGFGAGSME